MKGHTLVVYIAVERAKVGLWSRRELLLKPFPVVSFNKKSLPLCSSILLNVQIRHHSILKFSCTLFSLIIQLSDLL